MHYVKYSYSMSKITYLFILFFLSHFTFGQNPLEYVLNLEFETNIVSDIAGEAFGPTHKWKLEKYKSSCIFSGLEYKFEKKDTLLIRYFIEIKKICKQDELNYIYGNLDDNVIDGSITRGWFKSDSIDRAFGFQNGKQDYNLLQIELLNNFFNIAYYLIKQPVIKGKISRLKIKLLSIDEDLETNSPIRIVKFIPLTYRLCGRVYNNSSPRVMNLLNSLPKDKPIHIEVGAGFYTNPFDTFYFLFIEYLKSPNQIKWIPEDERIVSKLKTLGVKKRSIIKVGK
jgi:hypothetical protein